MAQPPARGGLSLYANLLDPNDPVPSSAVISSAPVLYDQNKATDGDAGSKKPVDPALRFQPIRRPQAKQAAKPKSSFPKVIPKPAATESFLKTAPKGDQAPPTKTLADWAATEEDEWMYGTGEKRQRGGRKKKKKRNEAQAETDWDEMYDPSKPTNVEEFLKSDEKLEEIREWKGLLYRHRRKTDDRDLADDEETRPSLSDHFVPPASFNAFAPPTSFNAFASPASFNAVAPPASFNDSAPPASSTSFNAFAPPASFNDSAPPASSTSFNDSVPPASSTSFNAYAPPPAAAPDESTGDDAYACRIAMSQGQHQRSPSPLPQPEEPSDSHSPISDPGIISQAPIRYKLKPANEEDEDQDMDYDERPAGLGSFKEVEDEPPRSIRPGQVGFAKRLMSKYGWTKGTGLGADESGIVDPLRVKVEKRRKNADADGGGWAGPAGKGKIIGGKRKEETTGKFGAMSEVIVLQHMLENMPDLESEITNGLAQEIGEECGEKYGRVERLYIDKPTRQVFIKFTNQVSALRAVDALAGRVFNGNVIAPKFFDVDKFEQGIYS